MTVFKCKNNCCNVLVNPYVLSHEKYYKRNRNKAGAFIYDHLQNKVLLVQSNGNYWGIPKGTLEDNENYIECSIREIKEETNIDVTSSMLNNLYKINNRYFYYYINIKECSVSIQQYTSTNKKNDVSGITWINVNCLLESLKDNTMQLNYHTKLCFKKFLNIDMQKKK